MQYNCLCARGSTYGTASLLVVNKCKYKHKEDSGKKYTNCQVDYIFCVHSILTLYYIERHTAAKKIIISEHIAFFRMCMCRTVIP